MKEEVSYTGPDWRNSWKLVPFNWNKEFQILVCQYIHIYCSENDQMIKLK